MGFNKDIKVSWKNIKYYIQIVIYKTIKGKHYRTQTLKIIFFFFSFFLVTKEKRKEKIIIEYIYWTKKIQKFKLPT